MISPKFKRLKTLKNSDDDRSRPITTVTSTATIPYLPDNVIEQILSFLPIKLVAQANAVSKQWADVWPSFPVIDLDDGDSDDLAKCQRFLTFLENCLKRCEKQRLLDKLKLRIIYSVAGDYEDTIDKWVSFAIQRCVKDLDLRFIEEAESEVSFYLIPQAVFSSNYLTSLNLEKVTVIYSCRIDGPVNLPSLKTMSLKEVEFDDEDDDRALPCLISGCPSIQHLSLKQCDLGYSAASLEISSLSLKSLEVRNCHSLDFTLKTINLESFDFVSECTCAYHDVLTLWDCYNLKHLYIFSEGLKQLHLFGCEKGMENSIFTPNLKYFMFSGVVEAKVHFVEAPSSLLQALIRITNYWWTFEYYSFLRDCLESFDCSRKVEIDIRDAEVLYTLFCNLFSATDILQLPVTHIAPSCFKSLRLKKT